MHLRGFTAHPSSGVRHPGTFEGLRDKIGYLKDLGVNCVELMPIFEFDELENRRTNPLTGERLCNYWGYSTLGFLAPKAGFAATGRHGTQVHELKQLVKALHDEGIEVMLDVVFNHTAEDGSDGPTISFRGIDNKTYYMLDSQGKYLNYTGCGNTVNCNHPVVRDSSFPACDTGLRNFISTAFDSILLPSLAATLMERPSLTRRSSRRWPTIRCWLIAILSRKLGTRADFIRSEISHPTGVGWSGMANFAMPCGVFSREMSESSAKWSSASWAPQTYISRRDASPPPRSTSSPATMGSPCAICFRTARSTISTTAKTTTTAQTTTIAGIRAWKVKPIPKINALRLRQQKNAVAVLFVSQGVPMIYMGDECGRTQLGNNNAYCQDEDWNWFDWSLTEKNADLRRFVKAMIAFRRANPALRQAEFLNGRDCIGSGYPDISWHGVQPWKPDWSLPSRSIAFMLCGLHGAAIGGPMQFIYCAMNMFFEPLDFTLPVMPKGMAWHRFADTSLDAPNDIREPGEEVPLEGRKVLTVGDRAMVILVGR